MPVDLEAALLRAFVSSVRAGSLSRAASDLGRTQPALSLQLRRLETLLGRPLLRRSPSGVTLTEAGEALLPYAERILALSAEALAGAGRERAFAGRCGIGLLEDLASFTLPSALADFAHHHPGVTLEVVTAPGPAMHDAMESGRIQLALCDPFHFPSLPRWTTRLPQLWAAAPSVDLVADPLPLVLFSQPCRWRAPVLQALDAAGRRWRVAFESTSLAGVQAAVRAGLGVAALLSGTLGAGMEALGPAEGLPALPEVEIGLLRRSGTEGDPLIDAVEAFLRRLA